MQHSDSQPSHIKNSDNVLSKTASIHLSFFMVHFLTAQRLNDETHRIWFVEHNE